jgi:hypothetical protein
MITDEMVTFIVVEDEGSYACEIELDIREEFKESHRIEIRFVLSEAQFYRELPDLMELPGRIIVILDTMVRWAIPEDKTPRSAEAETNGFHDAGGRCLAAVRGHARGKEIPVILHSNRSEESVQEMLKERGILLDTQLTSFVPKSGSLGPLLEQIQQILEASGEAPTEL